MRGFMPAPNSRGLILFFTGLPGAGKSTLAQALAARLADLGRAVTLLDGDQVRALLSSGLGYSRADRDLNVRRIGYEAPQDAEVTIDTQDCTPREAAEAILERLRRDGVLDC